MSNPVKPWERAADCTHVTQPFGVLGICRACIERACREWAAPLVEAAREVLDHQDLPAYDKLRRMLADYQQKEGR